MKRLILLITTICALVNLTASAQLNSYRVILRDKGPGTSSFRPGTAIYDSTLALHNQRCIDRRKKVLQADSLFTLEDAPVWYDYVNKVASTGAVIHLKLRWNNYLVVTCDSATAEAIRKFDFVKYVQPESSIFHNLDVDEAHSHKSVSGFCDYQPTGAEKSMRLSEINGCGAFNYGESYHQAYMLDIPALHSMGFTGSGVLIGFIDTGFRWRDHQFLSQSSIIAEHDFIFNDSVTNNEPNDDPRQISHGTEVFSTVAAYMPGSLIGLSPNSQFMLAKTEDMRSETRIEEDNYASALEWLESCGVDITSSSLGYFAFDSLSEQYSYSDLNGKTTISTQAINKAAARGVLCITAAGNAGPAIKTINAPADADSAVAVGALKDDGVTPASFTSRGPRGDGVMKPDISALGLNVVAANAYNTESIAKASGTSLSTPLIAGSAALILSAFPYMKPWELRNLLYSNSSLYPVKDTALGYGMPDVLKAVESFGTAISPVISYTLNGFLRVAAYILSPMELTHSELNARLQGNTSFDSYTMYKTTTPNLYAADIPLKDLKGQPADVYITAGSTAGESRYPWQKDSTVRVFPDKNLFPCGIDLNNIPLVITSASSFVYPSVVESGNFTVLTVPLNKKSDIDVKIFNAAGQEFFSDYIAERSPGIVSIPIRLDSFSQGAYFIRVSCEGRFDNVKFVVMR